MGSTAYQVFRDRSGSVRSEPSIETSIRFRSGGGGKKPDLNGNIP
jgi:hypothetical protein